MDNCCDNIFKPEPIIAEDQSSSLEDVSSNSRQSLGLVCNEMIRKHTSPERQVFTTQVSHNSIRYISNATDDEQQGSGRVSRI